MTTAPLISRRQLGRLSTDAALELNALAKGSATTFSSVGNLAAHLKSKLAGDAGPKPSELVSSDLGVMGALNRAFEVAQSKKAKDTSELTNMTDEIAGKLQLVGTATDRTTAAQLRDFCLSLSNRLSASAFEHLERRPINPWRRSV